MLKYKRVYTYARPLRKTLDANTPPLCVQIDAWQMSGDTQTFIKKMQTTAAKYEMKVRKINPEIGRGVVVGRSVPKKKQMGLYYGEITTVDAVKDMQGEYLMDFPYVDDVDGLILDGEAKINQGKVDHTNIAYVNHSCRNKNCEMVSVNLGEGSIIVLETIRKIDAGEALLVNYDDACNSVHPYWLQETFANQATDTETQKVMRCVCETPRCPRRCYRMVDRK